MKQRIVGFHQDEEAHWVAELECGHTQHVRHDPPMTKRPWVLTREGRDGMLEQKLQCKKCDADEPPDMETSHFWVGRFSSMQQLAGYFAEVYDDEDEDREQTPLSGFARDMGETWYDHDFLEYAYGEACATVEELADGYSYHEQWAAELARRTTDAGLTGVNTIVFISRDQIEHPRSIEGDGYVLHYLGTIGYLI